MGSQIVSRTLPEHYQGISRYLSAFLNELQGASGDLRVFYGVPWSLKNLMGFRRLQGYLRCSLRGFIKQQIHKWSQLKCTQQKKKVPCGFRVSSSLRGSLGIFRVKRFQSIFRVMSGYQWNSECNMGGLRASKRVSRGITEILKVVRNVQADLQALPCEYQRPSSGAVSSPWQNQRHARAHMSVSD